MIDVLKDNIHTVLIVNLGYTAIQTYHYLQFHLPLFETTHFSFCIRIFGAQNVSSMISN